MNAFQSRLGVRLFISYLVVVLVGVLALAITVPAVVPQAFNRHIGNMGVSEDGTGMMAGGGQGNGLRQGAGGGASGGMMAELFIGFRAGVFEALAWAAGAAIVSAVLISVLLSRAILRPLGALQKASQRIAEGHYQERVHIASKDELGQLADHFNQMAARLEQTEDMRRQLIGDVSHELRTPLTAIKGSMEGLMDGVLPAETGTFQQIHAEADRLNHLVDDLQELSRVEAGAYDLELAPVSLGNLVLQAARRLKHEFNTKGVELILRVPDQLPDIQADGGRVMQILTNLLGNALQYTPSGGHVTVSVTQLLGELQVSVLDTGVGIAPQHQPHLFDRFYRADKSRSRSNGGGSGIGLTIARHLVEVHGGRIWVKSEGEEKGSLFAFTLPVAN
jgi:two-component system, OmpR family, sensor histidine kinase BaeS